MKTLRDFEINNEYDCLLVPDEEGFMFCPDHLSVCIEDLRKAAIEWINSGETCEEVNLWIKHFFNIKDLK